MELVSLDLEYPGVVRDVRDVDGGEAVLIVHRPGAWYSDFYPVRVPVEVLAAERARYDEIAVAARALVGAADALAVANAAEPVGERVAEPAEWCAWHASWQPAFEHLVLATHDFAELVGTGLSGRAEVYLALARVFARSFESALAEDAA